MPWIAPCVAGIKLPAFVERILPRTTLTLIMRVAGIKLPAFVERRWAGGPTSPTGDCVAGIKLPAFVERALHFLPIQSIGGCRRD